MYYAVDLGFLQTSAKFTLIESCFMQKEILLFERIIYLKEAGGNFSFELSGKVHCTSTSSGLFRLNQWGFHWFQGIPKIQCS